MSDIAIRVENLSKRYRIGEREPYKALRDVLTDALHAPFRRLASLARRPSAPDDARRAATGEWIWAVQNIAFDIKRAEVVGIIGANGAGKSTLLKVLSRIVEPTSGYAEIHGRVGSLLEVGSGFHPELTGRENIYLNGAILGMKKVEIDRKFDEILAFAEVEKFIDTPVKHYSSGMYMRLAFAVAAHLEPEILIVDEVLAVGDAAFQKKCLGKMGAVATEGRTVLFVSHNMAAVQSLCSRAIWLHEGKIVDEGPAGRVVSHYLQTSFSPLTEQVWPDIRTAPGNDKVRIRRACVRPTNGSSSDPITTRTPFIIEFEYWNLQPDAYLNLRLQLHNKDWTMVFDSAPIYEPVWQGKPLPVGLFRGVCYVPGDLLNDGMHSIKLFVVKDQGTRIYTHGEILVFDVQDTFEMRGAWYGQWQGAVRPILEWSTERITTEIVSATQLTFNKQEDTVHESQRIDDDI